MILVDTNVISETRRPTPEANVVKWLDAQVIDTLYLSSVSLAELLYGVAMLPEGRRKTDLDELLKRQLEAFFHARILPFDVEAAKAYAGIVSKARRRGQAIAMADGQIAATAVVHDLVVATRDTAPFEAAGLQVVNPWTP